MTVPATSGGFVRSVDGLWDHLEHKGKEPLIFEAEVLEKSVEDGWCTVVMVDNETQFTSAQKGGKVLPQFAEIHITGFTSELEHLVPRRTVRIQGSLSRGDKGIAVSDPLVVSADVGQGRYSTWRFDQLDHPEAINSLTEELNVEGLEQHLGAELSAGKRILLISSKQSEAYEDIVRGDPAREAYIQLEHTSMQGKHALKNIPKIFKEKVDTRQHALVVIARGGGGRGSLAVFDHRDIQDAIIGSAVPTVTALGHYQDFPMANACSNWSVATPSDISHLIDAALGWDLFGTKRVRTADITELDARCEGAYQRIHATHRGQAAWKLTVWLSITFLLIMMFPWSTTVSAWIFVIGVGLGIYRYCNTRLRTRKMYEPGKYVASGVADYTEEPTVLVSNVRAGYRDARTPEDYQETYRNHQILLAEADKHRQLTLHKAQGRGAYLDDAHHPDRQGDRHIDLDDYDTDHDSADHDHTSGGRVSASTGRLSAPLDQPSKDAREHLTKAAAADQHRVISVAETDGHHIPSNTSSVTNPPVATTPPSKPGGSSPRIRGTIKK